MKGVIDRIVDGKWAVLLVGDEEKEYNVPLVSLPSNAKQGSIVQLELENEEITKIVILEDETTSEHERINDKLNVLRSRKKSNFKR
ncbi:DUF3006 domain-containing protein [Anaerobacillus alkaliphilus]|uniref:DUF3006 domain-containing protein n=1 Tax=Anaerobacillus alkaliphilus TaxID=1548597 RepID=UPI001375BA85|nr:DUF3006 domain-containing protein [Anaerobacillus alkaliphilus]